jgi:hypothetical protein
LSNFNLPIFTTRVINLTNKLQAIMSAAVESAPVANPPAESTDATQSAEVLASAAEGESSSRAECFVVVVDA